MVKTAMRDSGIITIPACLLASFYDVALLQIDVPVEMAYIATSLVILNLFTINMMRARNKAQAKSVHASLLNFRCKGVPVVSPRKAPIPSHTRRTRPLAGCRPDSVPDRDLLGLSLH